MLVKEIGDRLNTARSLAFLAKVIAFQGDQIAARAMYEESLALVEAENSKRHMTPGLEGLAGVLASQGDLMWAARLWGSAESLRDALGTPIAPVYHAEYERSIAAARSKLGDKIFEAAWAEGRTMTPEQALAAQSSVATPQPHSTKQSLNSPAKPSPAYPDGLTAREVEVLRLLAQGMTDAQIAEQLVISPRTVNNHLTSIYQKIQVSSRSAATRYAIDHGLD